MAYERLFHIGEMCCHCKYHIRIERRSMIDPFKNGNMFVSNHKHYPQAHSHIHWFTHLHCERVEQTQWNIFTKWLWWSCKLYSLQVCIHDPRKSIRWHSDLVVAIIISVNGIELEIEAKATKHHQNQRKWSALSNIYIERPRTVRGKKSVKMVIFVFG